MPVPAITVRLRTIRQVMHWKQIFNNSAFLRFLSNNKKTNLKFANNKLFQNETNHSTAVGLWSNTNHYLADDWHVYNRQDIRVLLQVSMISTCLLHLCCTEQMGYLTGDRLYWRSVWKLQYQFKRKHSNIEIICETSLQSTHNVINGCIPPCQYCYYYNNKSGCVHTQQFHSL